MEIISRIATAAGLQTISDPDKHARQFSCPRHYSGMLCLHSCSYPRLAPGLSGACCVSPTVILPAPPGSRCSQCCCTLLPPLFFWFYGLISVLERWFMIRLDKFIWLHGRNKAATLAGAPSVRRLQNSSRLSVCGVMSLPVILV